jgi:hypothetical protein
MKKILLTAVSFVIIAGICGLPHGESCKFTQNLKQLFTKNKCILNLGRRRRREKERK